MLLVQGWRARPLPCRGLSSGCPSTFTLSPRPPRKGMWGAAPWGTYGRGAPLGGGHLWVGGTQRPSVQPPPNSQGCLMPNVFQPRPQANFNFLVIMQMNVDLIKGRFH